MNHQFGSVRRFHFPLAHYRSATTGSEKRPRNSHHSFTSPDPPSGSVAGRKHNQVGAEVESHYFPRLNQSVFFFITFSLCEKQIRIERMTIIEHAMRCEMNRTESRPQALERFLVGSRANE